MKSITVPELTLKSTEPNIQEIENALETQNIPFYPIDCINWEEYPLKPKVEFGIAHANNNIYIKYNVHEKTIRAHYVEDNGSEPYEDSCVEFFISLDDNEAYYNVESNCIGSILFGGGKPENRVRYDDNITRLIKRYPSLPKEGFESKSGDFTWSIVLVVPANLLGVDDTYNLKGKTATANFYKCGDNLPEAQFLSWNPIDFIKPNFHLPEFFGEIKFE